jgi:hypothetical protein
MHGEMHEWENSEVFPFDDVVDFTCFAANHQEALYLCPILGENCILTAQIQGKIETREQPTGKRDSYEHTGCSSSVP